MDKWNMAPFNFKTLPKNQLRDAWKRYRRHFEYMQLANQEKNKTRLRSIFLALAGPDVQEVFESIPGANVEARDGVDPCETALDKLEEYFAAKYHDVFERNLFWTLKPEEEEPLEKFLLRVMDSARKCNFGASAQESQEIGIIDKMILQSTPDLREKLLAQEKLTLEGLTRIVNAHGSLKHQVSQLVSGGRGTGSQQVDPTPVINRVDQREPPVRCFRCGKSGHSGHDPRCSARNTTCFKCNKQGHLSSCCQTPMISKQRYGTKRKSEDYRQPQQWKKQRYNSVRALEHHEPDQPAGDSSGQNNFIYNIGDGDEFLWVILGGVPVQMLIDSGSQKNIIDDTTWESLKRQGINVKNVRNGSDQTFRPYGRQASPLKVLGMFDCTISIKEYSRQVEELATFYVVKGGSQPLLGKITAQAMGVLVLGLPSTNSIEVNKLWKQDKHVFPKIKGIKLKIAIDESVVPVSQHARRPPLALMDKVEDKLKDLERNDIIEKVTSYSQWVSPLVVIVKDNGEPRLCVDMRLANRAIKREAYMMPTFEDFLPRLTEARFFSRLDIKEAFHQFELDEDSRYITTFITHKGIYRYKRLLFGISCASKMFQRIMEQILSGCSNVVNYIDDILVFGRTKSEHDQALEKVLAVLKGMNVLLNHSKCVFGVTEVVFLGHHLSADGIRPAEDKLAALKSFRAPESAEELRSFLGLVNYVGRFLPDLATVTAPLRSLIGVGTRFIWEAHHQVAFETLKGMITNVRTLSYFDNSLRTRLIADASPVALGAVLVQFRSNKDDSNPLIISYASKSLTPTEMKYSQTEKEGLALVWGVERHAMYLLGRRFELETDHKPLEAIFAPFSKPCARMERWVLRLQAYTFKVIYKKGVNNIADSFSRLATIHEGNEFDGDNSYLILSIAGSAAIDTGEIEEASHQDEEFAAVRESLQTGIWKDTLAKPYEVFKNELGFVGDILVRGTRLVVPQVLRKRMIDLGHEGHPGETVMKSRLRDRVWWPGLDKDVLQAVKTCEGCRLTSLPDRPEPMARRRMPTEPWVDVAIDFLGPLPTGEYLLVIIDYFSRYKEVEIMTRITAKDTASKLDRIFTRLGYPVTITSDNGRQFVSDEFDRYCRDRGITLNFTTPYWPQENGLVEKQNRSLLKRLQISHSLKRDWRADLQDYLMMYYTTPHTTTGKTPTELAFGRTIRSKIPSIRDLQSRPPSTDTEDRDLIRKARGKEAEDAKRRAKPSEIAVGDTVLMRNLLPGNKLTTNFGAKEYSVIDKQGSRFTIRDEDTNKTYIRNSAHLKKVVRPDNPVIQAEEEILPASEPSRQQADNPDRQVRRYPGLPAGFRDFTM